MLATARSAVYGRVAKIGWFVSAFLHFPLIFWGILITLPSCAYSRGKGWKRILLESFVWHVTERLNARQLWWLPGSTRSTYERWAKANELPIVIDELGRNARLMWIGERRKDKVILYFHGGGLVHPLADGSASFWKYVQDELKGKRKDVGLAILNYTLVPDAMFPIQLSQTVAAAQHLISCGVSPSNIQLTGDSAGGNLILQLISHILHPVPSVDTLTLPTPFAGIYMMSPWVWLTTDTGSMITNNKLDMLGRRALLHWGSFILEGLPDSALPYMDAACAPVGWFSGIQRVTDRILISAGERECLRDGIVVVGKVFSELHPGARLIVQEHAGHCDPGMEFVAPIWEKDKSRKGKTKVKVGELMSVIVGWLADGWED